MKMTWLLSLLFPLSALAQVSEDLSDDFVGNRTWTGDTAYWLISNGVLQSHFTEANANTTVSFYVSTVSTPVQNTTWEFRTQLKFNTSSKNYVEVYVASDQENPRCGSSPCNTTHGYFVKIGSTQDDICLYRRDGTKDTLLIRGRAGITNHSNNILRIKIDCDERYHWSLFTDETGTGSQYFPEGETDDSAYRHSNYFSIVVNQSGKTSAEKHFFNDISIRPYSRDTVPPSLKELYTIDDHHISLLFSESLDKMSAENISNYQMSDGLTLPDSAKLSDQNRSLVQLYFKTGIEQQKIYQLAVKGILDLAKNRTDTTVTFSYYLPRPHEVIISEVYPDPTHSHGLPPFEYVEIKNNSGYAVNLEGWKFCNHTKCTALPAYMLQPGGFVLLCNETAGNVFESYGRYIPVKSFPALNNNADTLSLFNHAEQLIHRMVYNKSSYGDKSKSGGGWSLEMTNANTPCLTEDRWTASMDPMGGTPGRKNSVGADSSSAGSFLTLQEVQVLDSLHVLAHFNTIPEYSSASQPENFIISANQVISSTPGTSSPHSVLLEMAAALEKGKAYTLSIENLTGCGNIPPGTIDPVRFGISEKADSLDIIINEILFHPRTGSKDFVELFNRSGKVVDLLNFMLANRNSRGEVASLKPLFVSPYYLFPGEYVVFTEDKQDLFRQYFCKTPSAVMEITSLPAYPNVSGSVVLLNADKQILDEVSYTEKMHDASLHSYTGVSLERKDAAGKSDDPQNWHSASSVSGYATPTYSNSQSLTTNIPEKAFVVTPKTFSPDGDGTDDFARITYQLPENGYSGDITIYTSDGYLIRHLLPLSSLGTHGEISWDGKNDRMQFLPTGIYIIFIKIFNQRGTVKSYKLPVVLVKKSR